MIKLNIMFKKNSIYLIALLLFSSCGIINIRKTGDTADKYNNYSEELSISNLQFEDLPVPDFTASAGEISGPINQDLDRRISQITEENDREKFINGFTILIYSGADRERAFEVRNEVYSEFPDIQTYMEYNQPRYLVKVGRFINKIEALATYEKLDEIFPSSRITPDRFLKNREKEEKKEENLDDAAK